VAVRIALPKGKLLDETAAFLEKAGWQLNDYSQTMRNYRLKSARFPEMLIKVFQEKDIPIRWQSATTIWEFAGWSGLKS
jgi:ATP phosphoribosyltransferase